MTTRDARGNPWGVIAALGLEGSATGALYVDDGESLVQENGTLYVEVRLKNPSNLLSLFSFSFFCSGMNDADGEGWGLT